MSNKTRLAPRSTHLPTPSCFEDYHWHWHALALVPQLVNCQAKDTSVLPPGHLPDPTDILSVIIHINKATLGLTTSASSWPGWGYVVMTNSSPELRSYLQKQDRSESHRAEAPPSGSHQVHSHGALIIEDVHSRFHKAHTMQASPL
jgi:hypothetical protein